LNRKPIDLPRIRAALARLDALALEHPEAFGGRTAQQWTTILEESEAMVDDSKVVGFRLPQVLLDRIDAFGAQFSAANAGLEISRSDAVRLLLTRALDAEGVGSGAASASKTAKPKRGRK
jgi:hypothetical protein